MFVIYHRVDYLDKELQPDFFFTHQQIVMFILFYFKNMSSSCVD